LGRRKKEAEALALGTGLETLAAHPFFRGVLDGQYAGLGGSVGISDDQTRLLFFSSFFLLFLR